MSTTSTTPSTSSLISSTNWLSGNGIDVTSTVNSILQSERGPETQWESQQATLTSEQAALTSLQGEVSSLESSYQDLSDSDGVFSNLTATSSDTSVLSASTDGTAAAGTHSITVNSLATTSAAYMTTALTSASSSFTGGDLVFKVGSKSEDISLTGSNTTLTAAANYINQQNAGVTAAVITDSTGARLALTATASGSAGNITITSAPQGLGFTTVAGTDASLNVDGVPITSSSNTVQNVIQGVTLNLSGTSPSSIELNVSPDTTAITTAASNFVSAYNTVMNDLNSQFATSSTTGSTAGVLEEDPAAQTLQTQLLSVISQVTSDNSAFQTVGQLGITMNDDGTLSLDSSTLQSALTQNYSAVMNFFQDTSNSSFSQTFQNLMSEMTDSVNSPIVLDLNSDQQTYNDLQNNINNLESQLSDQQTLLTNQYSTVNAELQMLPEQVNGVDTLLGLNTNSSSSSS